MIKEMYQRMMVKPNPMVLAKTVINTLKWVETTADIDGQLFGPHGIQVTAGVNTIGTCWLEITSDTINELLDKWLVKGVDFAEFEFGVKKHLRELDKDTKIEDITIGKKNKGESNEHWVVQVDFK